MTANLYGHEALARAEPFVDADEAPPSAPAAIAITAIAASGSTNRNLFTCGYSLQLEPVGRTFGRLSRPRAPEAPTRRGGTQLCAICIEKTATGYSKRSAYESSSRSCRTLVKPSPCSTAGGRFVFAFSGPHPHPDGRFEIEHGEFVVVVGPTLVEAFTFRNTVTKFKTHHDSQLLPSDR
jgi:hypothetical protein